MPENTLRLMRLFLNDAPAALGRIVRILIALGGSCRLNSAPRLLLHSLAKLGPGRDTGQARFLVDAFGQSGDADGSEELPFGPSGTPPPTR